jgi:hypothetical protein
MALAIATQVELGQESIIKLLPDQALGTDTRALVQVAVAPLRAEPRHASELLSQVLLGQEVALLEQANADWYRVRNWDGYIGFIHREHIFITQPGEANGYFTLDKYAVFANYAQALSQPEADAEPVFDVSAGCIVGVGALKANQGVMYRTVYTPDMRMGYFAVARTSPFAFCYITGEASSFACPPRILAEAIFNISWPNRCPSTSEKHPFPRTLPQGAAHSSRSRGN